MPSNQGGTFRKEHLDWASAENPNGKTPRLTSANKNNWYDSSFWMKSAAYLRLKNIQLGYELPKSWMHRIGLNSAYLYVNAQNLFTVTNFWDGYDPVPWLGLGRMPLGFQLPLTALSANLYFFERGIYHEPEICYR